MAFRISKRGFIRWLGGCNSYLSKRTYPVRRNDSVILPDHRPFSSERSKTSPSQLSSSITAGGENLADLADLFRSLGFSDSGISEMERQCPSIFKTSHRNSLPFKLNFLGCIGLSGTELMEFVLRNPFLLASNFEKKVIPCYNYLKNLPVGDERLMKMLKDNPGILLTRVDTVIAPNIELLREMGVPNSFIPPFLVHNHNAICRNHEKFKICVDQAMAVGLDPVRKTFLHAVRVLCGLSKETWDHKVKLFRSFGLSDDDIVLAFRKQPYFMSVSEKKMEKAMEFFLKELRWAPSTLANSSELLRLSLERRVVPRYRVMEVLTEKGLLKNMSLVNFLKLSEEKFLNKFIYGHKGDLPELIGIYSEKPELPPRLE